MATAAAGKQDDGVSFVDFKPRVIDAGSKYSTPKYEDFRTVIERANQWLGTHPEVKVQTCESIDIPLLNDINKQVNLDVTDSVFYEPNKGTSYHLIFLRLWLLPNDCTTKTGQQIGYVDQLPVCTHPGGTFSTPEFESLGQTLNILNDKIKSNPLPGYVINMETQKVAFLKYKDGVNPETTCWAKFANKHMHFLAYLRVYYVLGETAYEELGCADFVPHCLEKPTSMTLGEYESMDTVIQHAKEWLLQNPAIKLTNLQTIMYPATKLQKYQVNSQSCFSYELGSQLTSYVRILRVNYTQAMPGHEQLSESDSPVTLTSRAFTPPQVTFGGSYRCAKFEKMELFVQRIQAWCKLTGEKILCVETSFMPKYSKEKVIDLDPNNSSCHVFGSKIMGYVCSVRVYFNGRYDEPPEGALPPLPDIVKEESDGCIIS